MNKKSSHLLLIVLTFTWVFSSCNLFLAAPSTETKSSGLTADPGLSNREYAQRLQKDGWPIEILNTASNANYLSDVEKNMVLAHNLIRHNPVKYAELYVAEYMTYFKGNEFHYPGVNVIMLTQEGISPVRELYRELKKAKPLPLMYPSRKLSKAAESHASYQSRNGQLGHDGQGGMRARIEKQGKWEIMIGENIAYGNWSAHDAIIGLMIDDGVPDRGHRINILKENFRVVGVAHRSHPKFEGGVYVINYAGGFEDVKLD
jgi:uncharacterized protein YkwD